MTGATQPEVTESAVLGPLAAYRSTVDADNPWPGLLPFGEADRDFFHGRRRETEALVRLVLRARLCLLFGLSGLGKSSLLQAGVFPRLRRENVLPIYVRFDFSGGRDLVAQVKEAIAGQAELAGVEAPAMRDGETLWQAFHRRDADFWSPRNRLLLPLLAFDQFEELFTLGRGDPSRAALVEELADLAEGRPPAALKARLDARPEEAEAFAFGRHRYKILLVLREDFLPELEGLRDRIAGVSLNRLRLRPMDGTSALEVVGQAPRLIAPGVAEQVVRFVAKAKPSAPMADLQVDPALLSVVCRELNNRRRQRGEATITADLLEGVQDEILSDFYERSLADLAPEVRTLVEDELLVEGYRDSVALEKALSAPGVTPEAIDRLVARRLVRVDPRGGVERLELTHDLLTGVIAESRDRRHQREAEQKALAARMEAEKLELEARRKLRRSRVYSAVLIVALLLSLGGAWLAWRQTRALANSKAHLEQSKKELEGSKKQSKRLEGALRDAAQKAEEVITKRKKEVAALEAALKRQREVEEGLRALLDAKTQARAEAQARLREAEKALRESEVRLRQARSEAEEKDEEYSDAKTKLPVGVRQALGELKPKPPPSTDCAGGGPVARISEVVGTVEVHRFGDFDVERVRQRGSKVSVGDVISTGAGASATLTFSDGSSVDLAENTRVVVDCDKAVSLLRGDIYSLDKDVTVETGGIKLGTEG